MEGLEMAKIPQNTIIWVCLGYLHRRCFLPQAFLGRLRRCQKVMKGIKKRPLTFENNSILRNADIAKSPSLLSGFEKYLACLAQVISENADPLMHESLDRLH